MSDPYLTVTVAASALAGLGMTIAGGLAGWRGWLQLKERQLAVAQPAPPSAGGRIEIADLKERIRKLEAIAAGVEL